MTVITITSRGVSVDVDTSKLNEDVLAKLLAYGITQKVGDAASGAAKVATETGASVEDVTKGMMSKAVDALIAGEWSIRTAGEGVSERTKVERAVMRNAVKVKLGSTSPKWKEFTGLSDADQNAKLDAMYATNAEKLAPAVDAELKRREDARKAKAKLADGLSIDI